MTGVQTCALPILDPGKPESIAQAIRCLEDSEKREEISRNNRIRAEEYSLEKIVEQYRQVYLDLCGGVK